MSTVQTRLIGAGVLFLFIFLSGYWLNRSGAPYSTLQVTVHKFAALGAAGLLAVTIVQANQVNQLGTLEFSVIGLAGLLFIGTIATGGLLSTGKEMPAAAYSLHQVTPFLTVLATAALLYVVLAELGGYELVSK